MNPIRRSPYAPITSTTTPTIQTYYPSAPAVVSASVATPNPLGYSYVPTSLPPSATDNNQYYTSYPSTSSSAIPIAHLEISTPSQGAIIAISIICGLLLLALLLALILILAKRFHQSHEHFRIDVEGGEGGGHHHRRKRHRSEKSSDFGSGGGGGAMRGFGMGDVGARAGRQEDVFLRPGPLPNFNGEAGVGQGHYGDPRAGNLGLGRAHVNEGREVEEVEEGSEVSTSRSGSEGRRHASKASSSNTRGRHRRK